jgi:hypothetical protein
MSFWFPAASASFWFNDNKIMRTAIELACYIHGKNKSFEAEGLVQLVLICLKPNKKMKNQIIRAFLT